MQPLIAVPAATFRRSDGALDLLTVERYASLLSSTWVRHVIVAGPMSLGERCNSAERRQLVEIWAKTIGQERVIAACWTRAEIDAALDRGTRVLAMLRAVDGADLIRQLRGLPPGVIAYTNRRYSSAVLTAETVALARADSTLDAVKLSKATFNELRDVRQAGGPDLHLIHGSSRHIAKSLSAGVDVVVSAPLATLPAPWPAPDLADVQRAVDAVQRKLDAVGDHHGRVAAIEANARAALA